MTELEKLEDVSFTEESSETSVAQRLIFDAKKFKQIEKQELNLTIGKIFDRPVIKKMFHRETEDHYVISNKEHCIDITQAVGKTRVPLVSRESITQELNLIKNKDDMRYIYFGAIEIMIKACFKEGINTPLELYLADDRIISPIDKSIVAQIKGNLIYQKLKFTYAPNYTVALTDKNINKSLVLYWKLGGIDLIPGSKVMTIKGKSCFVLSNKHRITGERRFDNVHIENPFKSLVTVLKDEERYYWDNNPDELEIVRHRLENKGKAIVSDLRINQRTTTNSYAGMMEQSKYYLKVVLDNQQVLALVDTGAYDNYISADLVKLDRLVESSNTYKDLIGNTYKSFGRIIKEVTFNELHPLKIRLTFEVQDPKENQTSEIIIGSRWLDQMAYQMNKYHLTIKYAGFPVTLMRYINE